MFNLKKPPSILKCQFSISRWKGVTGVSLMFLLSKVQQCLVVTLSNYFAKSNKYLPKHLAIINIFLTFAAWKKKIYDK